MLLTRKSRQLDWTSFVFVSRRAYHHDVKVGTQLEKES